MEIEQRGVNVAEPWKDIRFRKLAIPNRNIFKATRNSISHFKVLGKAYTIGKVRAAYIRDRNIAYSVAGRKQSHCTVGMTGIQIVNDNIMMLSNAA